MNIPTLYLLFGPRRAVLRRAIISYQIAISRTPFDLPFLCHNGRACAVLPQLALVHLLSVQQFTGSFSTFVLGSRIATFYMRLPPARYILQSTSGPKVDSKKRIGQSKSR